MSEFVDGAPLNISYLSRDRRISHGYEKRNDNGISIEHGAGVPNALPHR